MLVKGALFRHDFRSDELPALLAPVHAQLTGPRGDTADTLFAYLVISEARMSLPTDHVPLSPGNHSGCGWGARGSGDGVVKFGEDGDTVFAHSRDVTRGSAWLCYRRA